MAQNFVFFGGGIWSRCNISFFGTPKSHILARNMSFDVFIVKIGVGILAVGFWKNQTRSRAGVEFDLRCPP